MDDDNYGFKDELKLYTSILQIKKQNVKLQQNYGFFPLVFYSNSAKFIELIVNHRLKSLVH